MALAEVDGVKRRGQSGRPRKGLATSARRAHHPLEGGCNLKRMANPSYGIDVVAVAVAVVLAAAIVLLAYQVVPDLTDLMMMPPPLSGG